jgi:hypothetical protein
MKKWFCQKQIKDLPLSLSLFTFELSIFSQNRGEGGTLLLSSYIHSANNKKQAKVLYFSYIVPVFNLNKSTLCVVRCLETLHA